MVLIKGGTTESVSLFNQGRRIFKYNETNIMLANTIYGLLLLLLLLLNNITQ